MKQFHIFQFVHDQRIVLMKNPFLPIQTGQWGCQGREARSGSVCDSSLCTRREGREALVGLKPLPQGTAGTAGILPWSVPFLLCRALHSPSVPSPVTFLRMRGGAMFLKRR